MPLRRLEHCHWRGKATLIQIKKAKLPQPRQERALPAGETTRKPEEMMKEIPLLRLSFYGPRVSPSS